jgi:hypothetical protein
MTRKNKAKKSISDWYGVLAVFETSPSEDKTLWDPVFEIRVMLLRAASEDEAMKKGAQLAHAEEDVYMNALNQQVSVRFKEVLDVSCLSWVKKFTDGTETYYRYVGAEGLAEIKRALRRTFSEDVTPKGRPKARR